MKNTIRIDHEHRQLVMDRTFAKRSENIRNEEYAILQSVRQDYPEYQVVRRHIKKNTKQEHYKGLTYGYMRDYIINHTDLARRMEVLTQFDEMILISKCHSKGKRYPVIKQWFLQNYPEVSTYVLATHDVIEADSEDNIVSMPQEPEKKTGEAS